MGGDKMFKIKKWLWTKITALKGHDRAYAKYLAHFNEMQEHTVNRTLQKELNVKPMSKEDFVKLWKPKQKSKAGCC
jgi:hypothetical protein